MSGILDLLNSDVGKQLVEGASSQLGVDKKSAVSALSSAIPLILGGMQNNVSSPQGAAGILGALGNSKHDGSILDNLGSILGGSNIDEDVLEDGVNILGHVFSGQTNNAATAVSKASGLDVDAAMGLMKTAAPFVMGYLGKQAKSSGISDENGLSSLLGGLLGEDADTQKEAASKIQDFDNNDLSVDDIAGMIGGKSGGILGALGKMLG